MNEEFAKGVSEKPPWWATAPIWLAAGIVGVPSLIAIGAGYFVAHYVTTELGKISSYNMTEIHLIEQHAADARRSFQSVIKYMDDDLRAQYQTCINSAKTAEQRSNCLSPSAREKKYGFPVEESEK